MCIWFLDLNLSYRYNLLFISKLVCRAFAFQYCLYTSIIKAILRVDSLFEDVYL